MLDMRAPQPAINPSRHVLPARPQLASIGCPNEEANRRELREMLFTSPGIENYISGVVGAGAAAGACEHLRSAVGTSSLLSLP
jgi:hypothetical protein